MNDSHPMIAVQGLSFAYPGCEPVLRDVSFAVGRGAHVAVMGPNGSGKTTLALLLKGLLEPSAGMITVDGIAPADELSRFEIMKRVGLVFQNPDNTIVATTVERELAFGLENMGTPPDEITSGIDGVLRRFDLERYRHTNPSRLSGGEKQRCALAAVMVMRPACLVLDEPTSLLDPAGRFRILDAVHGAARDGATVVHITPYIEEALAADRVIVIDNGVVACDGAPKTVLADRRRFRTCGMADFFPERGGSHTDRGDFFAPEEVDTGGDEAYPLVRLENAGFRYGRGTPCEIAALDSISLDIPRGSAAVILGPSGAGKTTLLEILAGLEKPSAGTVAVEGNPVRAMAFQFPEDQMFGDTVGAYVGFGPHNLGVRGEELAARVDGALEAVGLDPAHYRDRNPLMLSGGEERRAALAGVLAMHPGLLMLDEPDAGLDRRGMELVIGILAGYTSRGGTLVFTTHDFEMARRVAGHAVVLVDGHVETAGEIGDVFERSEWLRSLAENTKT